LNVTTPTCRCGAIDVHTHVVPEDFPPYLGSRIGVRWPSMAPAQPCHRHVMLDGAIYRTVSHQSWDSAVRSADMDAMQVEHQVLSPMPELLSYWLEGDDATDLCRFLNESIAAMVQRAPARFTGLAAVPLQDVELAIAELDRALHQFGLAGVEIGSNVNGVPIGDPRFRPFFQAAAQWGAAVFVHALRPSGMDRLIGPPILEQTLAFPGEVGLAAASMITGGTLAACPGLRVAFSHGGGTLAQLLPRLQHAWGAFPALQALMPGSPRDAARTMYYDDLVYDDVGIRHLLDVFGPAQLLLGSDYPFAIMDRDPVGRLAALGLDAATADALRGGNARRWLGRPADQTRM
jgi:aminocarboxymuconate-semialdehyde decarboxylase